jgi:hypothetical protein
MNLQDTPICLSGGANGADLQWGVCAGLSGHQVIHFSFDKHRTQAPEPEVVVLTAEQLCEADPHLERANATLGRRLPFDKPWVINLLRRNWYQVRETSSVYAVASLDPHGTVTGGTAWAIQMFIDRQPPGAPGPVYLFDQERAIWLTWGGGWQPLNGIPPRPEGIWTGIGSRTLTDGGKAAIRRVFGLQGPLGGTKLGSAPDHHPTDRT